MDFKSYFNFYDELCCIDFITGKTEKQADFLCTNCNTNNKINLIDKVNWIYYSSVLNNNGTHICLDIDGQEQYTNEQLMCFILKLVDLSQNKEVKIDFNLTGSMSVNKYMSIISGYIKYLETNLRDVNITFSYTLDYLDNIVQKEPFTISDYLIDKTSKNKVSLNLMELFSLTNIDEYLTNENKLEIIFDIYDLQFCKESLINKFIELIKSANKNIYYIPENKAQLPIMIYQEAFNIFCNNNNIPLQNLTYVLEPQKLESICFFAYPYHVLINSGGYVKKCRHVNDNQAVGNVKDTVIDFDKFISWIIPDYVMMSDKKCWDCFYLPCCYGMSCKKEMLESNKISCPEKFFYYKNQEVEVMH